jgi:hypothetical protein
MNLSDSCLGEPQRFQLALLSSGGPVRAEIYNIWPACAESEGFIKSLTVRIKGINLIIVLLMKLSLIYAPPSLRDPYAISQVACFSNNIGYLPAIHKPVLHVNNK